MELISFERNEEKGEAVVSVSRKDFEKSLDVSYNYQKKWFNIPGFRKGKVPRGIIENKYGEDIFYDGAMQEMYTDFMNFLQKEKNEKFITLKSSMFGGVIKEGMPSVVRKSNDKVEIKIPLSFCPHTYVKYEDISISVEGERKASAREIEERKNKLFEKYSEFQEMPEDYVTVNGDLANVSMRVAFIDEQGNDLPEDQQYDIYTEGLKNFKVGIGSGRAWQQFEEAMVGHSKKEGEFSSILTFPEEKKLDIFSGKRVRFIISINKVEHLVPPSLEKLLEILKLESEKDLNKKIETEINNRNHFVFENDKDAEIKKVLQDQVSDDLVFAPLLKAKTSDSLNRLNRNLKSNGLSLEAYCKITGSSPESLNIELEESVNNELKLIISLLNISESLKFSVSEDEVNNYIEKISKNNGVSDKFVKSNLPLPEIYTSILCDKAMDYLKGHVSVKEIKKNSKDKAKRNETKEKVESKEEENS